VWVTVSEARANDPGPQETTRRIEVGQREVVGPPRISPAGLDANNGTPSTRYEPLRVARLTLAPRLPHQPQTATPSSAGPTLSAEVAPWVVAGTRGA
jgi:hypothetical protein